MNTDETRVKEYLSGYGLRAERLETRASKTPDFRVLLDEQLRFFCEVKSIEAVSSDVDQGSRPDPIFNRLTDDIHTAIKQFSTVNPGDDYPNVLALVNHDEMCDVLDLIGVFTGRFVSAEGETLPIYLKFSQGRIKDEKKRIHLFIWLDDKQNHLVFTKTCAKHHQMLCSLFGVEPSSIVIVGG
jgi:hypothetical protein